MTRRRHRHRVDIAATVSLDIVTERSELPAAQVEALLAAHANEPFQLCEARRECCNAQ